MSNLPPHLDPNNAQPYGGYPPPAYAYIPPVAVAPVPVMPMPMYPQPHYPPPPADSYQPPSTGNPTYVTNHYYPPNQPPPEPVHVVDHAPQQNPPMMVDEIDWVPATPHTADSLAHRAVVAGKEPGWDSSPLWVIRAHHGGELIPGKLAIKDRRAYIPNAGQEIPVHNFQVLTAPSHAVRWIASNNGQIPAGAIPGGNTHNGEPLYIGRARHGRSLTPGKIHPSHGSLYISFGGLEMPHKHYEVLCRVEQYG